VIKAVSYWSHYGGWQTPPEAPRRDKGGASLVEVIGAHLEIKVFRRVNLHQLADNLPIALHGCLVITDLTL